MAFPDMEMLEDFLRFCCSRLNLSDVPNILFKEDKENGKNILGKTGYFHPSKREIVVFTHRRHPKDILRTLSHELVHYSQFEKNPDAFLNIGSCDPRLDEQLRSFEKEAYEVGNIMMFRDWEEGYKRKKDAKKGFKK